MPEWTARQRAAIDSRGQNLLVSAAAGSGKTAVMVERVKGLVLGDRVPLDRILVVTFTNAAAAQMRARIVEALEKALGAPGDDAFLRAQIHGVDDAWISTLHAFCGRLLRRYYMAAGVDPGFRVLEEDQAAILQLSAMEDTLAAAFEAMPPGFELLADAWGGRDGLALSVRIERVYRFAMSRAEGLTWLDAAVGALDAGEEALGESPWMNELMRDAGEALAAARDCFGEALSVCGSLGGPASYRRTLEEDLAGVAALERARRGGHGAFLAALAAHGFGAIGRRGKNDDETVCEAVRGLRERGKDLVKDLKISPLASPLSEEARSLARMRPALEALAGLTRDFARRYAAEKAARSGLDFNDLEQYALRATDDGEIRRELREHFVAVFIDEYQDTNPVQERILAAVSREDNLFCVGDVKQSIYRFRQAEPAIFERRYGDSSPEEDSARRRIDMNSNFRSDPEILAGINFIFSRIMTPELGGVAYDGGAALRPGALRPDEDGKEPAMELLLLTGEEETQDEDGPEDASSGGGGDDELRERAVWEREALAAARRIREIMERPMWDGKLGRYRPARWRDFVILMRTVSGRAHEVASVLEGQGIPVFADASAGFFDRAEVAWLMAALQLVDNRWRDVPMIAALRSPMAGLTLGELLAVRDAHREEPFFAGAVFRYAQEGDDGPAASKLRSFLALLAGWKAAARHLRVDELMGRILDDTGLYDIAGGMPDGDLRQGNLRLLMDRARSLSDTPARGLYGFLRHIDRLRERSLEPAEARPISELDDVVRVMSVHRSKGLEFPVVLALGLGHRINMADVRDPLLLHGELGLGFRDYDMERRIRRDTLSHAAVACRLRRETLSEGLRVLYVAMTRARERLVLVGTAAGGLDRKLAGWAMPLTPALLARSGQDSPLDWVAAAALRHPAGEPLRRRLPLPPEPAGDGPARWRITLSADRGAERPIPRETPFDRRTPLREAMDRPADPAVRAALDWTDPHAAAGRLPAKTSATALAEQVSPGGIAAPEERPRPLFMEKTADPALRGTLVHTALRFITADMPEDRIAAELEELERRGILPPGGAAEVPPARLRAFLAGPVGRRAAAARRALREAPFVLSVPACELYPGEAPGVTEPVLVQGILDLAFEEEDGWVLVDYKTNRVGGGQTPESLLVRYRPQLAIYRRALETLTGRPVKAAGLYLIAADRMVWMEE